MARRSTSATRYAEAVFQVAREHATYDLWLRELAEVEQVLVDPLAAQVLLSPVVARERKAAILAQARPDLDDSVRRFLELLLRRERLELLPQIVQDLKELIDQERGLETARVTTAVPLAPQERELIAARLSERTGKRVRVEAALDPDIVGGVIAQIGDEIIDDSVRGRLEQVRRALAGT